MDHWLTTDGLRLGAHSPLPLDVPFTRARAESWGVSRGTLATLTRRGFLRPVLRGVYVASQVPDDMQLRARALSLVLPAHAVVVDRTAAWLHGVDVLPRSSGIVVPPVEAYSVLDTRMERAGVRSGRRGLLASDVTVRGGIRTTTALRTALDLGRLMWRYDALGALDGFLRSGVPHDILAAEVERFAGYRGVRQLRELVPKADARAESMGESALRLNWYDAGLPRPDLQMWVHDDRGVGVFRIDLGLEELRYAVEYDGVEFHSSEPDRAADARRRAWCTRERGWHFEVFTRDEVYRRSPDPLPRLVAGMQPARRNGGWSAYGRGA